MLKSVRNLLLLPVLTHGLSIDQYGLWESIGPGIALLCPWVSLQLSGAVVRYLSGRSENSDLREGYYSILFAAVGFSLGSTIVLFLVLGSVEHGSLLSALDPHFESLSFLILVTVANGVALEFLRTMRMIVHHSAALLLQLFVELALYYFLLQGGAGVSELLFASILARSGSLALASVFAVRRIGFSMPRFLHLRAYLAFTIPLVPNSAVYRLFDAADRFILLAFWTTRELSIYAAAYNTGSLFTSLLSPIQFVLYPQMASMWNNERKDELKDYISHALRFAGTILIPAVAGASFLAHSIFSVLVDREYLLAVAFFPYLALGFSIFSIGLLLSHILVIAGRTKTVLAIDATITAINLGLNLLLVPSYGIAAAVGSTLTCHLIYTLAVCFFSKKHIRFVMPWGHYTRCGSAAIVMILGLKFTPLGAAFLPLSIISGAAIYLGVIALLGGITHREIALIKVVFGRRN